jgi:hypothetical protein
VQISPRLKASYPQEMTIVLQHQFWDLKVTDDDFEVGLAFNGIPERLHIPLNAVKAFHDPAVQFGLQFTVEPDAGTAAEPPVPAVDRRKAKPAAKDEAKAEVAKSELAKSELTKPQLAEPEAAKAEPKRDQAAADKEKKDEPTSGEVVRLDRFRKK